MLVSLQVPKYLCLNGPLISSIHFEFFHIQTLYTFYRIYTPVFHLLSILFIWNCGSSLLVWGRPVRFGTLPFTLQFRRCSWVPCARVRLSAPPAFAGLPHDLIALCKNYILFSLIFCIVILFSISLFSSLTFFLFLFFLFILNHTFCNLPRFRLGFCRSFSNLSI